MLFYIFIINTDVNSLQAQTCFKFFVAYFRLLLLTHLFSMLNNHSVFQQIATKFAENIGVTILFVFTKNKYFSYKITLAI